MDGLGAAGGGSGRRKGKGKWVEAEGRGADLRGGVCVDSLPIPSRLDERRDPPVVVVSLRFVAGWGADTLKDWREREPAERPWSEGGVRESRVRESEDELPKCA